jgi:hypothetical protein
MLLSNETLRVGLSRRGNDAAQRWHTEAEARTLDLGGERTSTLENTHQCVAAVLSEADPRLWNSTILRLLSEYYDAMAR